MKGDVIADRVFDIMLEFLVEHFSLLDGQLAFFDQFIQNDFGFFFGCRNRADAGEDELADAFAQLIHKACSFLLP